MEDTPNKKFFEEIDASSEKELVQKFRKHYAAKGIDGEMDDEQKRETIRMELEYRTQQKLTNLAKHLSWLTWILIILTIFLYIPSMRMFIRLIVEVARSII